MTSPGKPEFSRPIAVSGLKEGREYFEIEASAEERAALAKRFSLISLDCLSAKMRLSPQEGAHEGMLLRLEGDLKAEVTQTCVVTLEPVKNGIKASFTLFYSSDTANENGEEIIVSPDDEEIPEPIIDDVIDLGEAAAEQLSLELDPFPHKPGVVFGGFSSDLEASGAGEVTGGPFAELGKLIKKSE